MTSLLDELERIPPRKPKFNEWLISLPAEERQALEQHALDMNIPTEALVAIVRKRCSITRDSFIEWRSKLVAR